MKANPVGRPTIMTTEVLDRLRQAYLVGATNAEACGYADISERVLYDYFDKNPEFKQKTEEWKLSPLLAAKTKVVNDIKNDTKTAMWYLERKQKQEFSLRQEMTGADGKDLPTPILGGITRKDDPQDN